MEKHHKSDKWLRLAQFTVERAEQAIIWHGTDGSFEQVNEAACKHLGYTGNELLGLHAYDINPELQKGFWPGFLTDIKKTKVDTVETFHRTKYGQIIPVEVNLNYMEFEGREYVVTFIRDITERKRNEEERTKAFKEIQHLKKQLELENEYLHEEVLELRPYCDIVGKSPALQNILRQIEMVASTDASVLITGESGVGKELIAREIHKQSKRNDRSMIRVNCASVPKNLYESEFFGHVKGAFTNAVRDRVGRFELAHQGTLFLDEVGEIPLELQSKLLRVLQEGSYERVGDEKTRLTNVRIAAATNRDLKKEIALGKFREDLYYRLNVFPIEAVPLRERKEDISLLAVYFLDSAVKRFNCPKPKLTKAHVLQLKNYEWPGNIRELQNIIERAVITQHANKLRLELPIKEGEEELSFTSRPKQEERFNTELLTNADLKRIERDNIAATLEQTQWKIFGRGGAAELIGLKPTTLISKIKKLGLKKCNNSEYNSQEPEFRI